MNLSLHVNIRYFFCSVGVLKVASMYKTKISLINCKLSFPGIKYSHDGVFKGKMFNNSARVRQNCRGYGWHTFVRVYLFIDARRNEINANTTDHVRRENRDGRAKFILLFRSSKALLILFDAGDDTGMGCRNSSCSTPLAFKAPYFASVKSQLEYA